jgi:hypothetical protein
MQHASSSAWVEVNGGEYEFSPTHSVENWLQSGISLGKTHYHITE